MPLGHLHILHPCISRMPLITDWLESLGARLAKDPNWTSCRLHKWPCNEQAGFNVANLVDFVNRSRGPLVVIQKVQAKLLSHLKDRLQRRTCVYPIYIDDVSNLWSIAETARLEYESGFPQIPIRELIASLIIRKLFKMDMWGGTALNKSFLWASDLPKGGFPKECCSDRDVLEVADMLCNAGILSRKVSQGEQKYALGDKGVIHEILATKSFSKYGKLEVVLSRDSKYVSASLLDYNEV